MWITPLTECGKSDIVCCSESEGRRGLVHYTPRELAEILSRPKRVLSLELPSDEILSYQFRTTTPSLLATGLWRIK